MKYCVKKNTTKIIDGSENMHEIMLKNAKNAGFTESEVEILTEKEYQVRKETEPQKPKKPTDKERLQSLEDAMLEVILNG